MAYFGTDMADWTISQRTGEGRPLISRKGPGKHGDETDPYGVMNGPFSE